MEVWLVPRLRAVLLIASCLVLFGLGSAGAQVSTLAEKLVSQLPPEPLAWRIETFEAKTAAEVVAGATGLVAETEGRVWLFTLATKGGASPNGTLVIEIGPIPVPNASQYLLSVELESAAPGERRGWHSHPGSEAWYVLAGELCLQTPSGNPRARPGQGLVGPTGGTLMQSVSTGLVARRAFILFALDATKPRVAPGSLPPRSC